MNIKLLITVLPLLGFSIGFFQSDNIKKVIEPETTAEVIPAIEAPQIERAVIERVETVVQVKDYDLEIKQLFKADEKQAEADKNQDHKIIVLELENHEQQKQIDAIMKWIGFNE